MPQFTFGFRPVSFGGQSAHIGWVECIVLGAALGGSKTEFPIASNVPSLWESRTAAQKQEIRHGRQFLVAKTG